MKKSNGKIKNGAALAAILAASIGCAVLGINVILCEVSAGYKDLMTWSVGVGPLSGKTLVATIVWIVAWFVLNRQLKDRELPTKPIWTASLVLIAVGILGTFPPFFTLFASH